jgi:hypothetical protein
MMKLCSKCKTTKPLGDFHLNRLRIDGRQTECKTCRRLNTSPRKLFLNHSCLNSGCATTETTCSKCKRVYPREEFYRATHAKDGHMSWCSRCCKSALALRRLVSPASLTYKEYRRGAKVRGLVFDLSLVQAKALFYSTCVYCGVAPKPLNGIDRVDNTLGYVADNVVTSCTQCNLAKRTLSPKAWCKWVRRLVLYALATDAYGGK